MLPNSGPNFHLPILFDRQYYYTEFYFIRQFCKTCPYPVHSSFIFLEEQINRNTHLQMNTIKNNIATRHPIKNAHTSTKWYCQNVRSCAADRRCPPPCSATNSAQSAARWDGDLGSWRKMRDMRAMFVRYLWQIWKNTKRFERFRVEDLFLIFQFYKREYIFIVFYRSYRKEILWSRVAITGLFGISRNYPIMNIIPRRVWGRGLTLHVGRLPAFLGAFWRIFVLDWWIFITDKCTQFPFKLGVHVYEEVDVKTPKCRQNFVFFKEIVY